MEFSPQQSKTIDDVGRWLKSDRQVYNLSGYAGTGKTTIARHLAELEDGRTQFAAYTGKAAHVMAQNGCIGARTLHSLLYLGGDRSRKRLLELEGELGAAEMRGATPFEIDGLKRAIEVEKERLKSPAFTLNPESDVRGCSLVIVDECSMVDERIGQDLLSFGTKVLVLGDPAQLPPVGGGGFFTNAPPDSLLTEVHRQAKDNPIIELATRVREGGRLTHGHYGDSRVVRHHRETRLDERDQLLVGTNKTRRRWNLQLRLPNDGDYPTAGDRLVCLRNNKENGLLNGSTWDAVDVAFTGGAYLDLTITPDDPEVEDKVQTQAHCEPFEGKDLDMPFWDRTLADEFDYGYALTVHKAQGSQWGRVVVFDESRVFKAHAKNWLYTALTRAQERVEVVRG